jgi:hypothetical protein
VVLGGPFGPVLRQRAVRLLDLPPDEFHHLLRNLLQRRKQSMRWYGCFLIGHRDGVALGCGGIRLLDWNTAEIERMYVAETVRGQCRCRHILRRRETAPPPAESPGSGWKPAPATTTS